MAAGIALAIPCFSLVRLAADVAFGHGSSALDYVQSAGDRISERDRVLYTEYGLRQDRRASEWMPLEVKYRLYRGLACERKADAVPGQAIPWLTEALTHYDAALAMSPANAYYHNNRARILMRLWGLTGSRERLRESAEAGRQAVDLAPTSPFFRVQWAVALLRTGAGEEARRILDSSFALSPDFTAKALAQMASEDLLRGDLPFAKSLLDEALRGNSSSAEAYQVRGLLLQKQGRTEDAVSDLMKARRLRGGLSFP